VQYLVWLTATIGILTTRRKAIREMERERRAELEKT
jgi:hypothetical protein